MSDFEQPCSESGVLKSQVGELETRLLNVRTSQLEEHFGIEISTYNTIISCC